MHDSMLGGTSTMNSPVERPSRNFVGSLEALSTPETNVSSVDSVRLNEEVDDHGNPKPKLPASSDDPTRNRISTLAATSYWTPEPLLARKSPALKSPPAPPIPGSNLEPLIDIDTIASESKHNADDQSDGSFSGMFVYQVPEQQPAEGNVTRRRRSLRPRLRLVESSNSCGICLPEAKRRQTWDPSMLKLTLDDLDNLE